MICSPQRSPHPAGACTTLTHAPPLVPFMQRRFTTPGSDQTPGPERLCIRTRRVRPLIMTRIRRKVCRLADRPGDARGVRPAAGTGPDRPLSAAEGPVHVRPFPRRHPAGRLRGRRLLTDPVAVGGSVRAGSARRQPRTSLTLRITIGAACRNQVTEGR